MPTPHLTTSQLPWGDWHTHLRNQVAACQALQLGRAPGPRPERTGEESAGCQQGREHVSYPSNGKLRPRALKWWAPRKRPHCPRALILVPPAHSLSSTNERDVGEEQEAPGSWVDPARVTFPLWA